MYSRQSFFFTSFSSFPSFVYFPPSQCAGGTSYVIICHGRVDHFDIQCLRVWGTDSDGCEYTRRSRELIIFIFWMRESGNTTFGGLVIKMAAYTRYKVQLGAYRRGKEGSSKGGKR